jgi:hypothetical protein
MIDRRNSWVHRRFMDADRAPLNWAKLVLGSWDARKRPRVGLNWVRGRTTMEDVLRDVARALCDVWEAGDWETLDRKAPVVLEVREEWMEYLTSRYFRCNNIAAHVGVQLSFVPVFPGDRTDDPAD